MQKSTLTIFVLASLFLLTIAYAEEQNTEDVNVGNQCLESNTICMLPTD